MASSLASVPTDRLQISSDVQASESEGSAAMEAALKIVMPWLRAQEMGELARTCRALAEAARVVTQRRVEDVTQGWEVFAVPVENHVDDCLYPEFQYTPFSQLSSCVERCFQRPRWGGREWRSEQRVSESAFSGAMIKGSVLDGPGIGCKCRGECSSRSMTSPDSACSDSERTSEEGRILQLANLLPSLEEILERRTQKRKRDPFELSSCSCGRFIGGQRAYDVNSKLRTSFEYTDLLEGPKLAEQLKVDRAGLSLEDTANSLQVEQDTRVDCRRLTGRVDEPPLVMECGLVCSCSENCNFRVSQKGLGVRVKVVRTICKGWGLLAAQQIRQGSFVCEYGGELITTHAARERQKTYDTIQNGKHWQGSALLTLREKLPSGNSSVRVNVDATKVGNVARFINHSCDGGNLMPCLIRAAGCVIPKLALFARRDIVDGEEITYSYGLVDEGAETSKLCYCATSACLGKLPSEQT